MAPPSLFNIYVITAPPPHIDQLQLYLNLEIYWDWTAVSEAIRGRPGYIIYYKLDKYKEIRRYISTYILQ